MSINTITYTVRIYGLNTFKIKRRKSSRNTFLMSIISKILSMSLLINESFRMSRLAFHDGPRDLKINH